MPDFPKAVSVIMRSFNEAWAIGETIRSMYDQDYQGEIELIIIDSGSSDATLEILKGCRVSRLIQIPLGTYVPGVVMNQGARAATHDWLVYLNADATPVGRNWLTELLRTCLETPSFGAAFSRQIPRPDCEAVFAHDYDRCFGPKRESVHWDHFFSMVSSATHRSVLEKHPFREDLQYAEDDEWTRRLIHHGFQIGYAEKSVVMHSHNYTAEQSYKRAYGDAKACAIANESARLHRPNHLRVLAEALKDVCKDYLWSLKHGHFHGLGNAWKVRHSQRKGRQQGHVDGTIQFKQTSGT
jgi:rhamnosyltransferase